MDQLQIATLLPGHISKTHVHSALPGAPTVPHDVSARDRGRGALAAVLHRLADAVAPATFTLSTGARSGVGRWDESPCRPSPTMSA